MAFKLLKRGNRGKMEAQEVVVPASTSLAAQVNRNEEASREESSIIKARVRAFAWRQRLLCSCLLESLSDSRMFARVCLPSHSHRLRNPADQDGNM